MFWFFLGGDEGWGLSYTYIYINMFVYTVIHMHVWYITNDWVKSTGPRCSAMGQSLWTDASALGGRGVAQKRLKGYTRKSAIADSWCRDNTVCMCRDIIAMSWRSQDSHANIQGNCFSWQSIKRAGQAFGSSVSSPLPFGRKFWAF